MTTDEKIAVMRHFDNGGKIQLRSRSAPCDDYWIDELSPTWNFGQCDYRIKRVAREWWVYERNGDLRVAPYPSRRVDNIGEASLVEKAFLVREVLPDAR